MKKGLMRYKNLILIGFLLVVIVIITIKVLLKQDLWIDNIAYDILVERLRRPYLNMIMMFITWFGSALALILIMMFLIFVFKDKKVRISIMMNLVSITLINQVLKLIVQRDRPSGYKLLKIGGYSFPSAHAMVSLAFYGYLIYLIYKYIDDKKLRNCLVVLNFLIIILIGVSRIYLGVHYCSDVIVGYAVALIYLIIYINLCKRFKV